MKWKEIFYLFCGRDHFFLWISTIISMMGTGVSSFATMWWILEKTGSVFQMGGVAIVVAVTCLVLGPILGSLVDRSQNHRNIFIALDFFSAATMSIIAILMAFNRYSLLTFYVLVAVQAALSIPSKGCSNALIQSIVPPHLLDKASSFWSFSNGGAFMLGPLVGGVLIAMYGAPFALLFDAISFVLSAFLKFFVTKGRGQRSIEKITEKLYESILNGFRHLKEHRIVFGLFLLFGLINLLSGALTVLMMIFVKEVLHGSAKLFGGLETVNLLGMILLSAFFSLVSMPKKRRHLLILTALFVQAIFFFLMGYFHSVPVAYAAMVLIGAAESVYVVVINSYLLKNIEISQMGRFYSFQTIFYTALRPVSITLFCFLLTYYSSEVLLMVVGGAIFVASFALFWIPNISRIGCENNTSKSLKLFAEVGEIN